MRRGHPKRGNSVATIAAIGAGALAVAMAAEATLGATVAASVTVQNTPVGVTPRYIGYNMGHYLPNSNTSAWLEYSGVNAFRFWAASNDYETTTGDDLAPYGDGVTTLQQFDARKAALRADPENPTYINWPQFDARFETKVLSGRNKAVLNPTMRELQRLGVEPILQVTRSNAYPYDGGWGGKWEQWQHYYAMGYHAAKNFDAQKLQMYNEPDLASVGLAGWEERMRLASDAFKSAVEDVNRIYGKALAPQVWAPVVADQDGTIDTWGKAALQNNRTDFAGRPQGRDNFDVYDVHRYSNTGYAEDQRLFDSRIPLYNASGANMPVAYTEFNRYTSGTWSTRADSLDNDYNAAEWAAIFPGAMSEDVKAMIAFKFNQTEWTSSTTGAVEPQKTGFHFVQESGDRNTTGGTRASESMRLIARAFKNERPRLGTTIAADGTYAAAASVDDGRGNFHYLSVNRNTADARAVTLNLAAWNLTPGQVISVQEVSQQHLGSVPRMITVPADGIVSFTQPKASTWLLTVPKPSAAQTLVTLTATADAEVSNAAPAVNFGLAPVANVARSATSANDQATYLKFNLGGNSKARVGRAFLQLTGSNVANADTTILHVYGIKNDAWTETGINWGNAPDLAGAADARLANVGTDAFPVGQLTWDGSVNEWGIEVTDFVRKHSDLDLSFVVIREERFAAGYAYDPDGDADTSRVQLNTREALTGKPRMSLFMTQQPHYYWNANPDSKVAVNFSAATSWDAGAAPNAPGAVAVLGDSVTAARTITMNAPATVGELRFDNWNSLTLAGSAPLTLSLVGGQGMVNVYKGSHTIDTPIELASSSTLGVGDGLALTITKPISGAGSLVKTGPGTVTLAAANTYTGATFVAGGALLLGESLTRSSNFTAQGDAKVALAAGGGKVIKTGTLAVTGTAQLDLADNRLVTSTAVGTASGGVYTGVTGMIQRAYNEGAWDGDGLTSSAAAGTDGLTTLAVADASDIFGIGETATATWSGQTVTGASTLVMYTYGGDTNFDGKLDADDYGTIDFNVLLDGPVDGYYNGDFNYDGIVNADDYGVIDFNILAQGEAFPTGAASAGATGVVTVPEPSAGVLVTLAASASASLRRRRRRASFR